MEMKKRIGYTSGMFDIFHVGHLDIIRYAKEHCDYLIVGVGTDEFLTQRKNRMPVMPYEYRKEIIKAIRYVDEVVPSVSLDKVQAYKDYHFDVMFVGDDHEFEQPYILAAAELKKLGVETVFYPHTYKTSSTDYRREICNDFKHNSSC